MDCITLSSVDTCRRLWNVDLENHAKAQGQSNKCICSWKSERGKKHVEYNLAMKTWGHVFRNEVLLREIIEGKMNGKVFKGRKRRHMLSDLASSAKYLEVKRAAPVHQLSGLAYIPTCRSPSLPAVASLSHGPRSCPASLLHLANDHPMHYRVFTFWPRGQTNGLKFTKRGDDLLPT